MSRIGYARVSTVDQELHLQLDALRRVGCERIYEEKASGATRNRPVLAEALSFLREGDTLVVWRLDRLGRSLLDLIQLVNALERRGIGFQSATEGIDTTTAGGRLIFHIFGALAEFERALNVERTRAGLAAARERGRVGGRPPALTPQQRAAVRRMHAAGEESATSLAAMFEVSEATIRRAVRAAS